MSQRNCPLGHGNEYASFCHIEKDVQRLYVILQDCIMHARLYKVMGYTFVYKLFVLWFMESHI